MVQSRVQYGSHWERTGALLQRSQRDRSRIDHTRLDGLLHQAREALLLQRYIQSDIPCHGCSLRDDCVATSRLYPSRTQVTATCRMLMTMPGIGPITAVAYAAALEKADNFKQSRAVGAWLGLTPRRFQSGEEPIQSPSRSSRY
jgi:hypothetical protein